MSAHFTLHISVVSHWDGQPETSGGYTLTTHTQSHTCTTHTHHTHRTHASHTYHTHAHTPPTHTHMHYTLTYHTYTVTHTHTNETRQLFERVEIKVYIYSLSICCVPDIVPGNLNIEVNKSGRNS